MLDGMKTVIRNLRESDIERVLDLWSEWSDSLPTASALTESERANLATMLEDIDSGFTAITNNLCLVAVADDAIVGFVVAGLANGLGEISELYVTPDARGQGVAGQLLEVGLTSLKCAGATVTRCLTNTGDSEAKGFLLHKGFVADMVCLSLYPESAETAPTLSAR